MNKEKTIFDETCEFCGKPFNSEYHMSDECIKSPQNEDMEDLDG